MHYKSLGFLESISGYTGEGVADEELRKSINNTRIASFTDDIIAFLSPIFDPVLKFICINSFLVFGYHGDDNVD
ncbi:uncharacterized protein PRCAT00001408001 [Priceomyces carsonii]|uniref:uncharacterized protein n=1 Tax=Priceomyces carsonii TaxID=28549 RepID=UPI002ED89F2F|nr:unnamed protein product [Priceomyces carsonii]